MDDGNMDMWASHLPVLVACVAKTTGPVLELGCGHYSTRVLHALCGAQRRQLVSCESNGAWLSQFEDLRSEFHEIVCAPDSSAFGAGPWDIVVVDSTPAQNRIIEIARLRPVTRLFIVHDTESGRPVYQYDRLLPTFPHRWDWKRYPAWTSVLSDSPLPDWLERLT